MIKVIIAGAVGRMGQKIASMVSRHPDLVYSAGFEATVAAAWLKGKPNGMYTMFDVLELQDL